MRFALVGLGVVGVVGVVGVLACGSPAPAPQQPVGVPGSAESSGDPPVVVAGGGSDGGGEGTGGDGSGNGGDDEQPAGGRIHDIADVMPTIQAKYMTNIKRCYKDALIKDPTIRGKLSVKFTLGENGMILRAQVSGLQDAELHACIEKKMAAWRFNIPDEELELQFTLALVPD